MCVLTSERGASNPATQSTTVNYDGQNVHVKELRDNYIQPYASTSGSEVLSVSLDTARNAQLVKYF